MTSDDISRCPWCRAEDWTATIDTTLTLFTCNNCGCIWIVTTDSGETK